MAIQTNDPKFESMLAHEAFRRLDPARQKAAVLEYKQRMRQQVPKAESFLDVAANFPKSIIQSQRVGGVPVSGLGMLPTTGQEMLDVGRAAIGSQLPESGWLGPWATGADITDPRGQDIQMPEQILQALEPQTPYGGSMRVGSEIAPFALGAGLAGTKGKQIGSAIKKFIGMRNLPEELQAAEHAVYRATGTAGKQVAARAKRSKQVAGRLQGSKIRKIKGEHLTEEHFKNALTETADEMMASEATDIRSLANEYSSVGGQRSYTPPEIQAEIDFLKKKMGRTARTILNDKLKTQTATRIPEFWKAKKPYFKAATAEKDAKIGKLTQKQLYNDIASGKIDPDTLRESKALQEKLRFGGRSRPIETTERAGRKLKGIQELVTKQSTKDAKHAKNMERLVNVASYSAGPSLLGLGFLKRMGGGE